MGSEVSLPCPGEGDQATVAGDPDGVVRMAGHQDHRRSDLFGPRAHVFVGSTEAFPCVCDEDTQREECGAVAKRVSGIGEAILGDAHMGKRIFCQYGWHRQYRDTELCERAGRRPNSRGTTAPMEGRQRMTLSGVVVP